MQLWLTVIRDGAGTVTDAFMLLLLVVTGSSEGIGRAYAFEVSD